MREGACGKRTAATPEPRPQAYLTLRKERLIPVLSAPQQKAKLTEFPVKEGLDKA